MTRTGADTCRMYYILNFKLFVCVLLLIGYSRSEHDNVVVESPVTTVVRKALVATARKCMSHINATEDDIEYLRKDPPYPEKAACIVKCLLEKIGIVKADKYSKSGFLTIVTPLVMRNKKKLEHMKAVAEDCDKEINHHEVSPCQLGNEITSCIFKYAPELHFKS